MKLYIVKVFVSVFFNKRNFTVHELIADSVHEILRLIFDGVIQEELVSKFIFICFIIFPTKV